MFSFSDSRTRLWDVSRDRHCPCSEQTQHPQAGALSLLKQPVAHQQAACGTGNHLMSGQHLHNLHCCQPMPFVPNLKEQTEIEPSHEIMVLFVLRKLILQMCMRSHQVGLDVRYLVGSFIYFHTSCVRTAKPLARLHGCAGSPEPSLVAYVISNIISWAGSNGPLPRWCIQSDWTLHCTMSIQSDWILSDFFALLIRYPLLSCSQRPRYTNFPNCCVKISQN